MPLFGPKAPCPHCGRNVRRPDDSTKYVCPHCGKPGPWASSDQAAAWEAADAEERRQEEARRTARSQYQAILSRVAAGAADAAVLASLHSAAAIAEYDASEFSKLNLDAVRGYLEVALLDDVITAEENSYLWSLVTSLGLTWDQINASYPNLMDHLAIASANSGLLPKVSSPQLIQKKGEVVHLEWPASLMKEVTLREFRAGYQGFSFPVGKTGIRYRVGGARGHSVVVGTQLQVADTGTLSVSSQRAVFIGARKTIEMPYSKLVNLTVYMDGVQFHQSNRQTAPLFKVRNGEVVAAYVNAAVRD